MVDRRRRAIGLGWMSRVFGVVESRWVEKQRKRRRLPKEWSQMGLEAAEGVADAREVEDRRLKRSRTEI